MKRTKGAAALALCVLLAGCGRSTAAAAEVLQALAATAALTDYAVVADTAMTLQGDAAADGLTMTQRMWRTGNDAMQKMTTYDVDGTPLFENGSACLDGVYYWYDGKTWAEDTTGIAAAANLSWMPLVSWPEEKSQVTVTESDGVYTVEIGDGAFPAMIGSQLSAMEAEEQALRAQGLDAEADNLRRQRENAAQAEYEALRYTIEVQDGMAVACTTYSRVRQPDTDGDTALSEITYTWRLTGTDAGAIADILGEVRAG